LLQAGLIGQIATILCLFEVFGDNPALVELRGCSRKLLVKDHFVQLDARHAGNSPPPFPRICIIAAGLTQGISAACSFRRMRGWPRGFFQGPAINNTIYVSLRDLPKTRATLLLRLMGPTAMRREAIAGLLRLPEKSWERQIVGRLMLAHKEEFMQIAGKDREMKKNLWKTYDDIERELLARGMLEGERKGKMEGLVEGKMEGLVEGKRKGKMEGLVEALQTTYRPRFGQAPSFIEHIGLEQDPAVLGRLLPLFLTGSPDEIAHAVAGKTNGKRNGRR
jgi:hypothetical protein